MGRIGGGGLSMSVGVGDSINNMTRTDTTSGIIRGNSGIKIINNSGLQSNAALGGADVVDVTIDNPTTYPKDRSDDNPFVHHTEKDVAEDVLAAHLLATSTLDRLQHLPTFIIGPELMKLFLLDMIGRHTARAKLFEFLISSPSASSSTLSSFRVITPSIKGMLIAITLTIAFLALVSCVYIASDKTIQWQRTWALAAGAFVMSDFFISSTLESIVCHYLIPQSLASLCQGVKHDLHKLLCDIFSRLRGRNATRYYSWQRRLDIENIIRSPPFSATHHLYASTMLAWKFPYLLESAIILSYMNHLPSSIQERWRGKRNLVQSRVDLWHGFVQSCLQWKDFIIYMIVPDFSLTMMDRVREIWFIILLTYYKLRRVRRRMVRWVRRRWRRRRSKQLSNKKNKAKKKADNNEVKGRGTEGGGTEGGGSEGGGRQVARENSGVALGGDSKGVNRTQVNTIDTGMRRTMSTSSGIPPSSSSSPSPLPLSLPPPPSSPYPSALDDVLISSASSSSSSSSSSFASSSSSQYQINVPPPITHSSSAKRRLATQLSVDTLTTLREKIVSEAEKKVRAMEEQERRLSLINMDGEGDNEDDDDDEDDTLFELVARHTINVVNFLIDVPYNVFGWTVLRFNLIVLFTRSNLGSLMSLTLQAIPTTYLPVFIRSFITSVIIFILYTAVAVERSLVALLLVFTYAFVIPCALVIFQFSQHWRFPPLPPRDNPWSKEKLKEARKLKRLQLEKEEKEKQEAEEKDKDGDDAAGKNATILSGGGRTDGGRGSGTDITTQKSPLKDVEREGQALLRRILLEESYANTEAAHEAYLRLVEQELESIDLPASQSNTEKMGGGEWCGM